MNILMLHNYYRQRGGEDVSTESEVRHLREEGHNVTFHFKKNDLLEGNALQIGLRAVWSRKSQRELADLIKRHDFDVMHVQNWFPQFSPAIYYTAHAAGLPVVQTIRNYRLFCPSAIFARNDEVCELCMGKLLQWPAVKYGCYRDSRGASFAVAAMNGIHQMMGTWQHRIGCYIALTDFARNKMIEAGLPANKIVVKPNFVPMDSGAATEKKDFVLYAGRLTRNKGILTILKAWKSLDASLSLYIVGEGPLESEICAAEDDRIRYLGAKPIEEVYELMGQARFVVFPSEWYETFGRVAIEAFAKGTPVLAARIGAIENIVSAEHTGLFFEPGDAKGLAEQARRLWEDKALCEQMGKNARQEYEQKYNPKANIRQLLTIYERVIDA